MVNAIQFGASYTFKPSEGSRKPSEQELNEVTDQIVLRDDFRQLRGRSVQHNTARGQITVVTKSSENPSVVETRLDLPLLRQVAQILDDQFGKEAAMNEICGLCSAIAPLPGDMDLAKSNQILEYSA